MRIRRRLTVQQSQTRIWACSSLLPMNRFSTDGDDLFAAQPVVPAPPAFELKKAIAFAVHPNEEIGVFLPDGLRRFERLEVLREPGSIEQIIAEVCKEPCRPDTTRQAARNAHRVDAGFTGPIRQWRTVQHHRPAQSLAVRRRQRHRPTGLAIAIENGRLAGCCAATSSTKRRST